MGTVYSVRAFYRFVPLEDLPQLQQNIRALGESLSIRGIILLAPEGINSTVAGRPEDMKAFWDGLTSLAEPFHDLPFKASEASSWPFRRLRVRLKKEIVTLGVKGLDPAHVTGEFVASDDWDRLIQDPDVMVIDVRNDYETCVGTFQGAVDPHTQTFREFVNFTEDKLLPHKEKPIAMFCTGGIRCEKASSYLKAQGFQQVYQLHGGILQYLEDKKDCSDKTWEGECFVFDRRISVGDDLGVGHFEMCYGCRHPLTSQDLESPHYKKGVHCHRCYNTRTKAQHRRAEERMRQLSLSS